MPRDKGGLGIPDVYMYYLAFDARFPLMWGYQHNRIQGSWEWLEEGIIRDKNTLISLSSLWYHPALPKIDNCIISLSCDIIKKVHKKLGITKTALASCPLWHNAAFEAAGNPL